MGLILDDYNSHLARADGDHASFVFSIKSLPLGVAAVDRRTDAAGAGCAGVVVAGG
jgi:hypothetical protein